MDIQSDYVNDPIKTEGGVVHPPKRDWKHYVKKYWYVGVILLLLITVGFAALYMQAKDTTMWKDAQDAYTKADYARSAKLLEGTGIPTDPTRLKIYAESMLATRQYDKALPAYEKLFDVKKDPDVKIKIGNIYNEKKNPEYDRAEKAYQEVIANHPSYVQAYINLSTMYKVQSRTDNAIAAAKKGVKANPTSVSLYELLVAMTMDKKDSTDFKEAVAKLKELNPSDQLLVVVNE
jgi:tetratricopeptide (TPR) repeat protein